MSLLNFTFKVSLILRSLRRVECWLFVLYWVHGLFLHWIKLILHKLIFTNIEVTFLVQWFGIFGKSRRFLFRFLITFFQFFFLFFSWWPIIQVWTISCLVNKLIITKLKMCFAHFLAAYLTNVISHRCRSIFLKVFFGNGLVIRLIVTVRELLHSIFKNSLLLFCLSIIWIHRVKTFLKQLITKIISISSRIFYATGAHIQLATFKVLLNLLRLLVHGKILWPKCWSGRSVHSILVLIRFGSNVSNIEVTFACIFFSGCHVINLVQNGLFIDVSSWLINQLKQPIT